MLPASRLRRGNQECAAAPRAAADPTTQAPSLTSVQYIVSAWLLCPFVLFSFAFAFLGPYVTVARYVAAGVWPRACSVYAYGVRVLDRIPTACSIVRRRVGERA